MSDFLMIVPPDFTEIPDATRIVNSFFGESSLTEIISRQSWAEVSGGLDGAGLLVPGTGVHEARFFRTDDSAEPFRLFVKWGPEL